MNVYVPYKDLLEHSLPIVSNGDPSSWSPDPALTPDRGVTRKL